jgi:hypothetical protein
MTQEWVLGVVCTYPHVTVSGSHEQSDIDAGVITNEIQNSETNPKGLVSLSDHS